MLVVKLKNYFCTIYEIVLNVPFFVKVNDKYRDDFTKDGVPPLTEEYVGFDVISIATSQVLFNTYEFVIKKNIFHIEKHYINGYKIWILLEMYIPG